MSDSARRTALTLLATIYAFGFIDRVVIALVAQQLKADFSISDLEIGLLGGTAFAFVNAFAGLPVARLAERFSRKWITTGALVFASSFTALCAITGSFAQLLVLRLGMAVGSAGIESPSHSMISDMYSPEKRASAMSLLMLGIPIAALTGSALGGTVAELYGWRATFLAAGGLGILVAVVSMVLVREPVRASAGTDEKVESIGAVAKTLAQNRAMRHLLIGVCVMGLGTHGVSAFLPAYFSRSFGMGLGQAGLAFGMLTGLGSLFGTILGGFGAEYLAKKDPRWLIAFPGLGGMIGAPIYVLGIMQSNIYVAIPILLVGSVFQFMVLGPAIAAIHGALGSRSRATGSALLMIMVNMVGQGLGPPLAGFVSDLMSASAFGSGDFAVRCAGAAGQIAGSHCAQASALGLRYAIALFAMIYVWAGLHLLWGGHNQKRTATAPA